MYLVALQFPVHILLHGPSVKRTEVKVDRGCHGPWLQVVLVIRKSDNPDLPFLGSLNASKPHFIGIDKQGIRPAVNHLLHYLLPQVHI